MGKGSSQWEFAGLFPPEATRQVLTVTELTGSIRRLLERELASIWITGEITNLRAQASGHCYFTLKDAGAQLPCVLFRSEPVAHRDALRDGQKLVLGGSVTVYEARGQYQLRVTAVELQGTGALQLAFERLKQKLAVEGLFAPERKRPLPRCLHRIGVVTSPTGAALRDVLHVIQRRDPSVDLILVPCRVQGAEAAREIALALRLLNVWSAAQRAGEQLDAILVTRGGGSLEDLWAFNEEIVARAIFNSAVPVVSAVGHEIDFTISDFVADLRAATPSAAAEILTEGTFASRQFVAEVLPHLRRLVERRLEAARERSAQFARRLGRVHPRRLLNERVQYLDDLQGALVRCLRQNWRHSFTRWASLRQRLHQVRPARQLERRRETMGHLSRRLIETKRQCLRDFRNRVANLEARLRLLSPENVLARGYSITVEAVSGSILRSAGETAPGQRLVTRLASGEVESVVEKTVPSPMNESPGSPPELSGL